MLFGLSRPPKPGLNVRQKVIFVSSYWSIIKKILVKVMTVTYIFQSYNLNHYNNFILSVFCPENINKKTGRQSKLSSSNK